MNQQEVAPSTERGRRKTMIGIVVSNKMDKTAVIAVERRQPHSLYRKIVRSTTRYKAHDPRNEAVLGDVVRIEETRPLSKEKRWRIIETLVRGNVADIAPREIGAPVIKAPARPEPVVAAPAATAEPPAAAAAEPEVAAEPEASSTENSVEAQTDDEEATEAKG